MLVLGAVVQGPGRTRWPWPCILLCWLIHSTNSSKNSDSKECARNLNAVTQVVEYDRVTKQLAFNNVTYFNETLLLCFSDRGGVSKAKNRVTSGVVKQNGGRGSQLVMELVKIDKLSKPAADDMKSTKKCCKKPCKSTKVQAKAYFSSIVSDIDEFAFNYVEGDYFLRFRDCSCAGGTCYTCQTLQCSDRFTFGEGDIYIPADECGNKSISYLSTFTTYPALVNDDVAEIPSPSVSQNLLDTCNLEVNIVFPACSGILPYSTAQITIYEASVDGICPDDFQGLTMTERVHEGVSVCNSSLCPPQDTGDEHIGRYNANLALATANFAVNTNTSYCVHLKETGGPACYEAAATSDGDICSVHYNSPVQCRAAHRPTLTFLPLSEPIFICCVCGVLLLSLLLLLWTVVKCKKEQNTPNPSPEPELIKNRNIPRSLTIDEMEHICRLRHQELVLVYFPDSERFKNLNRLFKNWLMSLTTLNVNDVTDIYDEKYSEGPDGILKNPDTWVSNLLSDPERRVILVTSKLAYECLVHIRKGVQPPRFALDEGHSQMLFSILKFLDSEMFRGNYRRLICVRYEDLKICSRKYGSESFNIVPGTEYVLPPHLEDIARWIHPIEAKPGLWADHRQQVKQFFDALREYRHHEDNIFTVSFYDGENGPLIQSDVKSEIY